jgi:hypothetical protein
METVTPETDDPVRPTTSTQYSTGANLTTGSVTKPDAGSDVYT